MRWQQRVGNTRHVHDECRKRVTSHLEASTPAGTGNVVLTRPGANTGILARTTSSDEC